MKITTISMAAAAFVLLVGCSKQNISSGTSSSPTTAAVPIAQPAMSAWGQGDKTTAVTEFVATDWSLRPLFATNSALSFSEDQFNAFSEAENNVKSAELLSQLDLLKQLARAVVQTGDDAAAKGDIPQARKCFNSLDQCGAALNTTNNGRLVQLVGQAFQKLAKSKMTKIGQ
jgi:hypothetical protein